MITDLFAGRRILIVAAHPDDAEWGCFGAAQLGDRVSVLCMTDGARGATEDRLGEARAACQLMGFTWAYGGEADTAVNVQSAATTIRLKIESVRPQLILTHDTDDMHQDHAAVARATEIAARYRPTVLLAYPTPSARAWVPNLVVPITNGMMARKVQALGRHRSQCERHYMEPEVVEGMARWTARDMACDYAEGFRWVWGQA